MKIPTYKNFEEKREHFQIKKIDTIEKFEKVFDEHRRSCGIYRGVNSASYKIYTSKQREFICNSTNVDYISALEENHYIQKYFQLAKISMGEFSCYSILQHYKKPTPFVDFTKNFSIALFFAMHEVELSNHSDEINDYVTVFFIPDKNVCLLDISDKLTETMKRKKLSIKEHDTCYQSLFWKFCESALKDELPKIFLLKDDKNYKEFININNNQRIIMQEGLFIYNNYEKNHLLPLEESLKSFCKDEIENIKHSIENEKYMYEPDTQLIQEFEKDTKKLQEFQERFEENIITSYEINKKLISDIKRQFKLPDKDLIYFDIEKILNNINSENTDNKHNNLKI